MHRYALVAFVACSSARPEPAAPTKLQPPAASPDRATVPLEVEGNRPFVTLTLRGADGQPHTGRFLVDSGGGAFLIVEPLAKQLGLSLGEVQEEEGAKFASVTTPPAASVGSLALDLDPKRVLVVVGAENVLPKAAPGHADGMFPGHLLAKYQIVFDYPNHTFTIAKPGVLAPEGAALPMPVNAKSGFARTELTIDGTTYGFLVDTGASFTMISQAVLKAWGDAHRDWERHEGAFGDAKTLGGQTLETMIVPAATWGTLAIAGVGMTSQREGVFEKWMSSMTAAPIVGSLAGNVLTHYRVELDYANQKLYVR